MAINYLASHETYAFAAMMADGLNTADALIKTKAEYWLHHAVMWEMVCTAGGCGAHEH